jgi:CBS domain-containing protein
VASTEETVEADVPCIGEGQTLREAGHRMRELGVTALSVRAENGEVRGTISQDMVVRSIAAGRDPKTATVGEIAGRSAPAAAPRQAYGPVHSGHAA